MFSPSIDYWILRPLSHARNRATEEELDERRVPTFDRRGEHLRLQKLQRRLANRLVISPDLRYLDVGCGDGGMAIALADAGAGFVTGIDAVPRAIAAAEANRRDAGLSDRIQFVCEDFHTWKPERMYDVVLSHEALEHIRDPERFLEKLHKLLKPSGIAVIAFGPLFHSPFGDHMGGFFKMQIPWRGVLFSEQAVLRLRREQFRPTDGATSYRNITGELNLLRYSEFLEHVSSTGWTYDFLDVNPQLRAFPLLYQVSRVLTRVPLLRDYFAASVYAILRPKS